MKNYKGIVLALFAFVIILSSGCGTSPKEKNNSTVDSLNTGNVKYSKDGVVLSLCFLSNITSGDSESSFATLQSLAVSQTQSVLTNPSTIARIGNWKAVWGPVDYANPGIDGFYASDLAMVLFQGADDSTQNNYVLSVAGTNSVSTYDWTQIDLNVDSMVAWPQVIRGHNNDSLFGLSSPVPVPSITRNGAFISNGMAVGLTVLLDSMENTSGQTVMQFLNSQAVAGNKYQLTVTGHSMGGALSPCVALSLSDNQSYWDPNTTFNITASPFAGPTPGNDFFASYFKSKFSQSNFGGWYNTNDVAPMAFNTTTTNKIPTLYDSVSGFPSQYQCIANELFPCFVENTNGFFYTSLYPQYASDSFQGTPSLPSNAFSNGVNSYNSLSESSKIGVGGFLDAFGCNSFTQSSNFAGFICFSTLVLQQHFTAYETNFGCDTVFASIQKCQNQSPVCEDTEIGIVSTAIVSTFIYRNCLNSTSGRRKELMSWRKKK